MTIAEANNIVHLYCRTYGLNPEDIRIQKGNRSRLTRIRKKHNGIHIDYMRMCLSYYFCQQGIGVVNSSRLAGYINHATVCQWRDRIESYIKSKDIYVFPYWERLQDVVNLV